MGPFIPYALFIYLFYKHRKVSPLYLHKEHWDMIQVQCEWIVSLCRTARRVRVIEDSRTRAHTSDQWETWEGKGGCICCHSDGRTAVLDTVTRQERESASEWEETDWGGPPRKVNNTGWRCGGSNQWVAWRGRHGSLAEPIIFISSGAADDYWIDSQLICNQRDICSVHKWQKK